MGSLAITVWLLALTRRDATRLLAGLATVGVGVLASACGRGKGDGGIRYKMIVEVQTPAGSKSGSAVREYLATPQWGANGRSTHTELRGEAVIVDLSGGRAVFALLRAINYESGEYNGWVEWAAELGASTFKNEPVELFPSFPPDKPGTAPRWRRTREDWVPYLVTFKDENDPTTVVALSPTDFAAVLGPGYSLTRITVELTNEHPLWIIRQRLRWLVDYSGPRLDPKYKGSMHPNLSQLLEHTDFYERPAR